MGYPERQKMLLDAKVEAGISHTLLEVLRSGQVSKAIELLEQRLDVSIQIMHRFARDAESNERDSINLTLRILREYRLRHPRKTEAVIGYEGEDELENKEAHERVRKILNEMPDV
jgi:hypothetical protein